MTGTLVLIVAYNAQAHIEQVLARIPAIFWQSESGNEVLLIDDASADDTVFRAQSWAARQALPLTCFRNPVNQRYGGTQKLGYAYAIERGFEAVVMLHGDGQYAPELLGDMTAPILAHKADLVLGSRMLRRADALKGGMPVYKWLGNQLLTTLQNALLHTSLSEFHTGYRAWSVSALKRIPFLHNSPDFAFDTEILIQCFDCGLRVTEIAIPTHYGDEICHVNGPRYAWQALSATIISRLQAFHIFYTPMFDYGNARYSPKLRLDSSHTYGIAACKPGSIVLDLGCGSGVLLSALSVENIRVYGIDKHIPIAHQPGFTGFLEKDLEALTADDLFAGRHFDTVLMLDVIEHLNDPETFLAKLRERFSAEPPKLYITTPNVAFITMRLGLLLGQFNYGKSGILDLTHRRLFTFKTIKRLLENQGYRIECSGGIPVPFELLLGDTRLARLLTGLNNRLIALSKSIFSFQIFIEAYPLPTVARLLAVSAQNAKS